MTNRRTDFRIVSPGAASTPRADRQAFSDRFWSKVDRRAPDECWEWTGLKMSKGYGRLFLGGHMVRAHRIAWSLANGREPGDLMVCHSCDNRACCNPAHLWLGSNQDNMRDAAAKGRVRGQAQTHCVHGHEYTPENTRRHSSHGRRECATCRRQNKSRARRRQQEIAA